MVKLRKTIYSVTFLIWLGLHAMDHGEKISIDRATLGLAQKTGKDEYLDHVRQLANILMLQEMLFNSLLTLQKSFQHYIEVEKSLVQTLHGKVGISCKEGMVFLYFSPNKPFETIEGFMALVNYRPKLATFKDSVVDKHEIELLKTSPNEECQIVGQYLEKQQEFVKATQEFKMDNAYVSAIVHRLQLLGSKPLTGERPIIDKLIHPQQLLDQELTKVDSTNELLASIQKTGMPLSPESMLAENHRGEYEFTTKRLPIIHSIYQSVRSQCLAYYSRARLTLAATKNRDLLSQSYATTEILVSDPTMALIYARDMLPISIDKLSGNDLASIKLMANGIYGARCQQIKHAADKVTEDPDWQIYQETTRQHFAQQKTACRQKEVQTPHPLTPTEKQLLGIREVNYSACKHIITDIIDRACAHAREVRTLSARPIEPIAPALPAAPTRQKKRREHRHQDEPQQEPSSVLATQQQVACSQAPITSSAAPEGLHLDPTLEPIKEILAGKRKQKRKTKTDCPEVTALPLSPGPKTLPDDSPIEISPSHIVVLDSTYNALLHLYLPHCLDTRTSRNHIMYTESIETWFADPEKMLYKKGLTNQNGLPLNQSYSDKLPLTDPKSLRRICFIHNFSRKVDKLILEHGITQTELPIHYMESGDTAIVLPGHVEYPSREQESCLYCYLFSKDPKTFLTRCFHRNIDFRPRAQLSQEYYKQGYFTLTADT